MLRVGPTVLLLVALAGCGSIESGESVSGAGGSMSGGTPLFAARCDTFCKLFNTRTAGGFVSSGGSTSSGCKGYSRAECLDTCLLAHERGCPAWGELETCAGPTAPVVCSAGTFHVVGCDLQLADAKACGAYMGDRSATIDDPLVERGAECSSGFTEACPCGMSSGTRGCTGGVWSPCQCEISPSATGEAPGSSSGPTP